MFRMSRLHHNAHLHYMTKKIVVVVFVVIIMNHGIKTIGMLDSSIVTLHAEAPVPL